MIDWENLQIASALLIYMLALHAICDYPLQGEWLSKAKNPTLNLVPGESIWLGALRDHALIHAVAVHFVTGSWTFTAVEFVAHFCIDLAKCRKWFGYNTDQSLHFGCKLGYAAVIYFYGMPH